MADTANIVLQAYDGARQLFPNTFKWTAQTRDGRMSDLGQQKLLFNLAGGAQVLSVPFFDNLFDQYTVIASANGYEDAAWYPVHVNDKTAVGLDMMFLPKDGALNFHDATWDNLARIRSKFAAIVQRGCGTAEASAAKYKEVLERRPASLACMLNLLTSLDGMQLPSNKLALDYYWNICWPQGDPTDAGWIAELDRVMQQDRIFCYVDKAIVEDVRKGVGRGFSKEPNPEAWGHKGATESYKQTQFDMANVQLTFHGGDTADFMDESGNKISCVKIEPDIDYYKDVAAHGLLEVLPNLITQGKTDPRVVYWMRWMTARREGLPDFNPLFTVEASSIAATV